MATVTGIYTQKDQQIRDAVFHQLDWEPDFNSSGVGVAVEEGVVTLTGFAENYADKLAIERAAKRVYGVRGVANDLEVKLNDERTDTEIAQSCVIALRNRVSVPPQVTVTVRHGTWCSRARSTGCTSGWRRRTRSKTLRGVKSVVNNAKVQGNVSATQVKDKIEAALRRNAEVDARRISVETRVRA